MLGKISVSPAALFRSQVAILWQKYSQYEKALMTALQIEIPPEIEITTNDLLTYTKNELALLDKLRAEISETEARNPSKSDSTSKKKLTAKCDLANLVAQLNGLTALFESFERQLEIFLAVQKNILTQTTENASLLAKAEKESQDAPKSEDESAVKQQLERFQNQLTWNSAFLSNLERNLSTYPEWMNRLIQDFQKNLRAQQTALVEIDEAVSRHIKIIMIPKNTPENMRAMLTSIYLATPSTKVESLKPAMPKAYSEAEPDPRGRRIARTLPLMTALRYTLIAEINFLNSKDSIFFGSPYQATAAK